MALKHQYTLFCHHVLESKNDNRTYVDCFSNIVFPHLPARLHFYVAVGFQGEPGDKFSITFDGPDGKIIETIEDDTISYEQGGRNEVVLGVLHYALTGTLFESEGIYSASLRHGNKVVHRTLLGVRVKDSPTNLAEALDQSTRTAGPGNSRPRIAKGKSKARPQNSSS